jgi:hypothetical protein
MAWGRLDDGFYDHPKIDRLGKDRLACVGLWTLTVSWCNRYLTNGFVPTERVLRLGGTTRLAAALTAAGLWEEVDGGYLIHDFLHFNESADEIREDREAARKRMRLLRDNRRRSREQDMNTG